MHVYVFMTILMPPHTLFRIPPNSLSPTLSAVYPSRSLIPPQLSLPNSSPSCPFLCFSSSFSISLSILLSLSSHPSDLILPLSYYRTPICISRFPLRAPFPLSPALYLPIALLISNKCNGPVWNHNIRPIHACIHGLGWGSPKSK